MCVIPLSLAPYFFTTCARSLFSLPLSPQRTCARSLFSLSLSPRHVRRYGLNIDDGRVTMAMSTKTAAQIVAAIVCLLIVYPLVAGGGGGGDDASTTGAAAAPAAVTSCSLPAPVGFWNVEYFGSGRFDVATATMCEPPNRPVREDTGGTAAVLALYAAIDTKDVAGMNRATTSGYTATIHGCASIGGTQGCPGTDAGEWSDGQIFPLPNFIQLINAHPARAGGTYRRELTVDAGVDGSYVVLNQYTMGDGSTGTAVHTVTGCPGACKVAASEWLNGALRASDVAGETAASTYISHFWEGSLGPNALGGQHNNFAMRYSGEFAFTEGLWQFWASSDDGSRLYVDGALILDRWGACCDMWHADPMMLTAGNHAVVLEYSQGGGDAFLELGWQVFQGCPDSSPLLAKYYQGDEIGLDASMILGGCTSTIRNDWGKYGPPELSMDGVMAALDHFSARWEGDILFMPDSAYIFSTVADDGSRLYLDERLLIDRWDHCCVSFSSAPIELSARDATTGAAIAVRPQEQMIFRGLPVALTMLRMLVACLVPFWYCSLQPSQCVSPTGDCSVSCRGSN